MAHPDEERANCWTSKVIAAPMEVHREKGPGLIESIYEKSMMRELELRQIPAVNQVVVPFCLEQTDHELTTGFSEQPYSGEHEIGCMSLRAKPRQLSLRARHKASAAISH